MSTLISVLMLVAGSGGVFQGSPVAQAPAVLAVDGPGGRGTLSVGEAGLSFAAAAPDKSRTWAYEDIQELRVESPTRIVLVTYEDGSRWRFGRDRRVTFKVTEGRVGGDLVAYLLERIPRPVMSAVMPAARGDAMTRVPAKHRTRGKGPLGTLEIYDGGLAFVSDQAAASRYWRVRDIQSVARLSPFELLVTAYEGGATEPFAFTLRAELPAGAFDALWAQVNPPAVRVAAVPGGVPDRVDRDRMLAPPAPAAAVEEPAPQRIMLDVTENAFEPHHFVVDAGRPVELVVTRRTDRTCGTEIVIGDGSQRADLPLGKPVTLQLGRLEKGELKVSCGMAMLKGTVVVK